jgi:hypothetical protein
MISNADDRHTLVPEEVQGERQQWLEAEGADDWKLHRWLVSFRSGTEWCSVGEFIAVDAAGAIERAVAVFGPGEEHKAEEIPWDTAPLPRMNQAATRAAR